MNLGRLSFLFLSGGIIPGVRHILAVAAPGSDVLDIDRACFVFRGQSECLGVERGFCLCLGLDFS